MLKDSLASSSRLVPWQRGIEAEERHVGDRERYQSKVVLLNRIKVSVLFSSHANSLLERGSRCACSNKEGRGSLHVVNPARAGEAR